MKNIYTLKKLLSTILFYIIFLYVTKINLLYCIIHLITSYIFNPLQPNLMCFKWVIDHKHVYVNSSIILENTFLNEF